ALHTHSGTTAYAAPWLFQMATWTPLVFGSAGLSVGLSYPIAERVTGVSPAGRLSWTEIAIAFAAFALLYAASGYLPVSNALKLVVLLAGAVALFAWIARTALALALAVLTAIVGPVVEVLLVRSGAFAHLQPDFLGIP